MTYIKTWQTTINMILNDYVIIDYDIRFHYINTSS